MPPIPSRDHEASETEDRILEAAHRVFLRHGTKGARTVEIAEEAGVNRALLHYYFRSKERLAEAVFLRAVRTLFPRMIPVLASNLPLREKLQQAVEIELDVLEQNPYLPAYLIAEFQYRQDDMRALIRQVVPVDRIRTDVLGTLQSQLDAEAEAGRLRSARAEDLMVALIAQLIIPFAAAPMFELLLGLDAAEREAMRSRQRRHLADALLRSMAP